MLPVRVSPLGSRVTCRSWFGLRNPSAAFSRSTVQEQRAWRHSALGLSADNGRMDSVKEEEEDEEEEDEKEEEEEGEKEEADERQEEEDETESEKNKAGEGLGGEMSPTAEVRVGSFVDDPFEYDDGDIGHTASDPFDHLDDESRDLAEVK